MKSITVESDIFIVTVIIVGGFLLIGGQFLLSGLGGFGINYNGNADNGSNSFSGGNGGTNPPGSGGTSDWSIEEVAGTAHCDPSNNLSQKTVAFHGTAPGYFRVDVKNGDNYQPIYIDHAIYTPFTPNSQNIQDNALTLANADGFNTKPWRVVLFQGGTISGTDLNGGTQKAEKDFDATNCP